MNALMHEGNSNSNNLESMTNASFPPTASPLTRHPLLAAGPLYAFSLPIELLQVISLRSPLGEHTGNGAVNGSDGEVDGKGKKKARESIALDGEHTAMGCSLCSVKSFESIGDQRKHFSSDWHRYNIKRRVANKASADIQEWERLVEGITIDLLGKSYAKEAEVIKLPAGLSDSLTGSASSSSSGSSISEDGDDESTVARILAKQALSKSAGLEAIEDEPSNLATPRSPFVWFEASSLVKDTQFGIYKTIFPSAVKETVDGTAWVDELQRLQVKEDVSRLGKRAMDKTDGLQTDPSSRTWTLFAVGGGHFAGMVVSLVPRLSNRNGRLEKEVVVLESKTFHRYTTRRKQGGAQSANDNAKGKAKSAGAQIRRYNETMLTEEIRALISSWRDLVHKSELVFVRASKTSRRIFFDYDESVLAKSK